MSGKHYTFRLNAQRAEFGEGYASIAYGLGCTIAEDTFTGPFVAAQEYLQDFAGRVPGPCRVFLRMAAGRDRAPPGYHKATLHVDVKGRTLV